MRARVWAFSDDEADTEDGGDKPGADKTAAEPEYAFPGFRVEFSRKVMLTPAGPGADRPKGDP
jgi:hypothetical protein